VNVRWNWISCFHLGSIFGCVEKNWYVLHLGVLDVNYHIYILVGFIEKKNEIWFSIVVCTPISDVYTLPTW
jgi:hypothetical protein